MGGYFAQGVVIPNQVFVKEVSFSSPNTEHLRDVETKVRAMLTTFRKESKIKEEEADMKKQGALMLDRSFAPSSCFFGVLPLFLFQRCALLWSIPCVGILLYMHRCTCLLIPLLCR